jgi:predicted nucleic acid-binding protein
LRQHGVRVVIPEITDYELRRELIRADKQPGLKRLDELIETTEYLPIHTVAMRRAAVFWAEARNRGMPTADDKSLDADMILAGQADALGESDVLIATTNVGHLSRFVPAEVWEEIRPE